MSDYDKYSTTGPSSDASDGPTRGPFPNAEAPAKLGKFNPKSKQSTAKLAGKVPGLMISLAKAEAEQAKLEMKAKAVKGGAGAALLAVVAFFGITLWAVLITAAILGLNEAFAPWLSALIVAGALLVIMIIAGLVGITLFKKMGGLAPTETMASLKQDFNAVKGMGKYE